MQGRDNSVGHLKACIPELKCRQASVKVYTSWAKAMVYKYGPQHNLDLIEEDLDKELNFARNVSSHIMNRRQDLYSSSSSEGECEYSSGSTPCYS